MDKLDNMSFDTWLLLMILWEMDNNEGESFGAFIDRIIAEYRNDTRQPA